MTIENSAQAMPALSEQDDPVAAAEAAIAALSENYLVWVKDDLQAARAALVNARGTLPDNSEAIEELFGVCHNIKGQGGSFGFQMMTDIAESLCDYIRDRAATPEVKLQVIEAHITALELVIEREIKGDGGEAGQGLITKLKGYVENAA